MEEDTVVRTGASEVYASFTADVARYFKLYLETGLHTGLMPMRQSTTARKNGLAVQLRLDGYQQLNKNLYKNFTAGLAQESFVVSQNKYSTTADDRLAEAFEVGIQSVSDEQASAIATVLARTVDTARLNYLGDRDTYRTAALQQLDLTLASELIVPLVRTAYSNVQTSDNAQTQNLATAASSKVFGELQTALETIALTYFASEEQNVEELAHILSRSLSGTVLRTTLRGVLQDITSTDAYQQIYDLHLSNQVFATTDLYLYFAEVSLRDASFPLFYTVLQSSHAYPSVTLHFGNRVFVNTRALEYVLSQYSQIIGQDRELPDLPRTIEIDSRNRKAFLAQVQEILDTLSVTFDIEKPLNLDSALDQSVTNRTVSLNNRLQLAVFNKLNDSLVEDYEALLAPTRASAPFTSQLASYITEKPVRYVQEVAEEWQSLPFSDKVLAAQPIPLNDEQKQVALALSKQSSHVIVSGAPGTGKTHLAASIALQAFAKGQSAMVLSNSPATLDTIQSTITHVFDDVRGKQPHHTPVLRFSAITESTLDEIEAPYLQRLTESQQTYTRLEADLKTARSRKLKDAEAVLANLTQNVENVNLQEVEQIVGNETHYAARDWIHDEPIETVNTDLQELHHAVKYIRASEANYLLPYIEARQQKSIAAFAGAIREYEKGNKNVHRREPQFVVRFRKLLPAQRNRLQSSLSYVHSNYRQFIRILAENPISGPFELTDNSTYGNTIKTASLFDKLIAISKDARQFIRGDKERATLLVQELISYSVAPSDVITALQDYTNQVESLKSKIFGFSGRTVVVENLTKQLQKSIPQFSLEDPERRLNDIDTMSSLTDFLISELAKQGLDLAHWKQLLELLLVDPSYVKELQKILSAFTAPADFDFMLDYRLYEADNLLANISLLEYATQLNAVLKATPSLAPLFGIKSIGQVLTSPELFRARFDKLANDLEDVKQLEQHKATIKTFIKTYPEASKRLGINFANGTLDVIDDTFANSSTEEIKDYLAYKKKVQDIVAYFREMTGDSFSDLMVELRQINATELSYKLDRNLLSLTRERPEEFAAIRAALRSGRHIAPALVSGLQKIFPVVLADMHNYATYLPLKKDLVDLLIIDGAATMGVAETLPALLRAKKVLILGDSSATSVDKADTEIDQTVNDLQRDRLSRSFGATLRGLPADIKNQQLHLLRDNFDVRQSIFSFLRSSANYETDFVKYFRSAPELISYVNKTFYDDSLRTLQARTLPLNELVRFTHVTPDPEAPIDLHANRAEIEQIVTELTTLRQADYKGTIGIVTPHHKQALLLQKELDEAVISDWFVERKLAVVTPDSIAGFERDYMFYSMVANPTFDEADHGLPLSPDQVSMNFSRTAETVHFVLSQPIENFSGWAGEALAHFQSKLSTGTTRKSNVSEVLTAAESLFPQHFYATEFYKKHKDQVRLVTQFSLGGLMKSLSPKSNYPAYKVDFLVVFGERRIVITFDEFKADFLSSHGANKEFYTNYLSTTDIYNQKLLEGYGFQFLRLNKFNLGSKPVDTLNHLLISATKHSSWPRDNGFLG